MFSTPVVVHSHNPQVREAVIHYQHEYRAVARKLGKRAPGRNIVKWGLPGGHRATVGDVRRSLAVLSRMLHPAAARVVVEPKAATPAPAPVPVQSAGATGLESCIIQRESGGNPAAPGSVSGGYYQGIASWSPAAWQESGGTRYAPTPDGASVAQQKAALAYALAHGMAGMWTPFDGC